jgi:hypothetical protein
MPASSDAKRKFRLTREHKPDGVFPMLCTDKSTTFLRGLGYNVVRHPAADLVPLSLIGRQNNETIRLGPLNLLIKNPPGPLPQVTADTPAADINGQVSAKIDIGIGASILGTLIGAMGGAIGVNVSYTNAQKVQFSYLDVLTDAVVPLAVGSYLKNGDVDAGNLILEQYVMGNGELFLVTKIAKSHRFTVKYEKRNETAASVDLPALQALASASVKVTVSGDSNATVTFEGKTPLAFGFQCFRVGVVDGVLSLTTVQAGAIAAAVGGPAEKPQLLSEAGMLRLTTP